LKSEKVLKWFFPIKTTGQFSQCTSLFTRKNIKDQEICLFFSDDLVFTDDEETHEFESLTPVDSTDEVTSDENNVYVRFPVIAPATPVSPPTTRATSAHYPRKLRACEKKTDLYILQPERLNTSGQSNPLKGKLTNCHITGCER